MRKSRAYIAISIFSLLLLSVQAWALEVPAVNRYVTDQAGVLGAGNQEQIENLLAGYNQSTGNQFVVLIVSSLEGESLEDYSLRVAEKNQIGKAGQDNGLLLLVSVNDRKMRFEVGYGLEHVLTDALTSVIIRDIIAAEFRNGDYANGIYQGMQAAIKATTGEFVAPERSRESKKSGKSGITRLIVFVIILFFALRRRKGGRGGGIWFLGGFPGGGMGGGGGGGFGGGGFGGFSGGGGGFGGGGSSGGW
jgi:uncharacterized protein